MNPSETPTRKLPVSFADHMELARGLDDLELRDNVYNLLKSLSAHPRAFFLEYLRRCGMAK